MNPPSPRRQRPGVRLAALLSTVLAALAAAAFTAPAAPAYPTYVHGDTAATGCSACHMDNHTNWPVAAEVCIGCHTGYRVPDPPTTCWTCHTPGQDMGWARADAACTADCHLADGSISRHEAHAGGSPTCTSCHPVSPSATDAGGSPHHDPPAPAPPVVGGFAPAEGPAGTVVTVTGSGFGRVVAVTFGGVRASTFSPLSDTQLTAVVPYGAATGPVAVLTAGGTGTSAESFVVPGRVSASLTVSAAPRTVARGARVTVRGSLQPAALAGATVDIVFERRTGADWARAGGTSVASSAAGAFGCTWRPPRSGSYRVRAVLAASATHTGAHSAWAGFRAR